jgi:NIMA (never in mitosis gene a)-related kinase
VIEEYKELSGEIDEEKIIRYIQGILLGVEHLHKNKIVHGNLKPENILFDSKGNIKISDYCISNELENTLKYANTSIGARTYASAEQLMGISFDCTTDIWSIGCIIHELCCLKVSC